MKASGPESTKREPPLGLSKAFKLSPRVTYQALCSTTMHYTICVCVCVYTYIYIYREREIDREVYICKDIIHIETRTHAYYM